MLRYDVVLQILQEGTDGCGRSMTWRSEVLLSRPFFISVRTLQGLWLPGAPEVLRRAPQADRWARGSPCSCPPSPLSAHPLVSFLSASPSFPPLTAFEGNGLKVVFHFAKDPASSPQCTVITADITNESPLPMTDFVFQAAVPKVRWCGGALHRRGARRLAGTQAGTHTGILADEQGGRKVI